jgi:geranylgeranyl diphosphate synthase, type I
MDFKKFLSDSAQKVDQLLEEYLQDEITEAHKISNKLTHLITSFASQTEGGKRLRGSLVKLGYELAQGDENDDIFKAALAYEIVQTSLLAHDDIVDKSLTRRGKPTMYQSLGGDHYGMSQTIVLGDIGFFLAYRLITECHFFNDQKIKAINYFSQSLLKTGVGEMLDIESSSRRAGFEEQEALTISHFKTAHYTIIGPLQLGASLAGAGDVLLENLEQFGEALGIAYQIQDDILGVFGDEEELGKSASSDIEEGKNTLLIVEALKKASAQQSKFLKEHYGQGKISLEDLVKIKEIFIKTGALDYSRAKAVKYVEKAKQVIPNITTASGRQQLLEELADYLVERKK